MVFDGEKLIPQSTLISIPNIPCHASERGNWQTEPKFKIWREFEFFQKSKVITNPHQSEVTLATHKLLKCFKKELNNTSKK